MVTGLLKLSLLLLLMVGAPVQGAGACRVPKRPVEVNVFLDFNASWREVKVAQEEACKQGKALRVIPDWSQRVAFSQMAEEHTKLELRLEACVDEECIEQTENKMGRVVASMEEFHAPRLERESIDRELRAIEQEFPDADLGRLLISGHDGGGNFNGFHGGLSRQEIYEVFDGHPRLRESVKGLYLLGCNSGTTMELSLWGSIFPKATFVSGYEGQAPLNFRAKGLDYLASSLRREEEIMAAKTQKEVEDRLLQIDHIREGFTGLRLICPGLGSGDGAAVELNAFGLPQDKGSFLRSDPTAGCHSEKFEENHEKFLKYYHGQMPIPHETGPSSPVRALYNFASSNAHCMKFQEEFKVPVNVAFGLNFYHAFKRNSIKSTQNLKDQLREELEMDIDRLYDQYDEHIKEVMQLNKKMEEAGKIFEKLHGDKSKVYTTEQMWDVINTMEEFWKNDLEEGSPRQLLLDTLKVAMWNGTGESISHREVMSLFKNAAGKADKPSRRSFRKKYGPMVEKLNKLNKEFYNLLPEEQGQLLSAQASQRKLLKDATRAELLNDFTIRNKEINRLRAQANAHLLEQMDDSSDSFYGVITAKAFETKDKVNEAFSNYQSGAIDLECVPFTWHEELDADDPDLGKGDPCELRQM